MLSKKYKGKKNKKKTIYTIATPKKAEKKRGGVKEEAATSKIIYII